MHLCRRLTCLLLGFTQLQLCCCFSNIAGSTFSFQANKSKLAFRCSSWDCGPPPPSISKRTLLKRATAYCCSYVLLNSCMTSLLRASRDQTNSKNEFSHSSSSNDFKRGAPDFLSEQQQSKLTGGYRGYGQINLDRGLPIKTITQIAPMLTE